MNQCVAIITEQRNVVSDRPLRQHLIYSRRVMPAGTNRRIASASRRLIGALLLPQAVVIAVTPWESQSLHATACPMALRLPHSVLPRAWWGLGLLAISVRCGCMSESPKNSENVSVAALAELRSINVLLAQAPPRRLVKWTLKSALVERTWRRSVPCLLHRQAT